MGLSRIFTYLFIILGTCLLFYSCKDNGVGFDEIPEDTFWETATPSSQQMNEEKIQELESTLQEADGLYSFLVIRNGKIISETYLNGASGNALLHLRSVTKSVTGLLTGINIYNGPLESEDLLITDFFSEIPEGSGWENVKVYHLLNMITGMDWEEELDLQEYENHLNNPLLYIFSQPIIYTPGTVYQYNSTSSHLLSYIIQRTAGINPGNFAQSTLWNPLGVNGFNWETDGNGIERGGAGLELTARDLAKIGLLFLQNGEWEGQQMVSDNFINETLNNPLNLEDYSAFGERRNFWWTRKIRNTDIHYTDGYGGQVLLIAPEFNLIIVTNRKYRVDGEINRNAFDEFFNELLPAVLDSIIE